MTEIARSPAAVLLEPVSTPAPAPDDFWTVHAWIPLILFVPLFSVIEWTGLDRILAHALFYDPVAVRWLGGGAGDWWARGLIHDGGRWLARSIAATALALWIASFLSARMRQYRRTSGFVFLAMAASVLVV